MHTHTPTPTFQVIPIGLTACAYLSLYHDPTPRVPSSHPILVHCSEDDTIGDLKKLVAAQTGTKWDKIQLKNWYTIYKDHVTLADYEIHDGKNLELYYT